jgi:hypothetical protein
MQVVLIMLRNGGERRSFSVVGDLTTIGRREDCDLRIPVGDVSRKHCRLVVNGDVVRVQDLGSSNGTFVNGQQVQDAVVNAGDTISVGPVNFIMQIDGVPAEDDLGTPPTVASETGAGGTALALAALTAPKPPTGDAPAEDGLLEPIPDVAADAEPLTAVAAGEGPAPDPSAASDDLGVPTESSPFGEPVDPLSPATEIYLDELPPGSSEEAAFDFVDLDEGPVNPTAAAESVAEPAATAAPPAGPAAKADEDDWDFLIEQPDVSHERADVRIDLNPPRGH